jgi:hypothetical protein
MNRLARCSSKIMKSMPDMPGEPSLHLDFHVVVDGSRRTLFIHQISWHLLMVRTDLTVDLVIQIRQVPWDLWKYSEHYEDGNLFGVNRPQLLKLVVHMLFQHQVFAIFKNASRGFALMWK